MPTKDDVSLVLRRLPARFGRARSHSSGTRFAAGCFPVGRSTRPRGIQADVRQMVTRAAAGCLISPSLPARQPPANIARTVRDRRACGVGRDHACPFGRGALRSAGCAPSSMDCARMFVVLSLRRPRALLLYGRDSIPSDATDGLDRRPASGWRVDKGCGRCGNGRPGTGVANCGPPFERHAWRSEAPIPRSQNGCFTWNIGRRPSGIGAEGSVEFGCGLISAAGKCADRGIRPAIVYDFPAGVGCSCTGPEGEYAECREATPPAGSDDGGLARGNTVATS